MKTVLYMKNKATTYSVALFFICYDIL